MFLWKMRLKEKEIFLCMHKTLKKDFKSNSFQFLYGKFYLKSNALFKKNRFMNTF